MLTSAFDPVVVVTTWPAPLGEIPAPAAWDALLSPEAATPLPAPDAATRAAVRDLLRAGGFSPSGRNKPCSEYIAGAAREGRFPRVDAAVDTGNLVALHSGLPTGVLDVDLLTGPLRFELGAEGASYVFNRSGQELALRGLLVLADAQGPCASPIKDPQRSKTTPDTRRTLTLVYGTSALPGLARAAGAWVAALHTAAGGQPQLGAVDAHGVLTLP
jgi:DNA/RNA-binding domain of Phe-tRNA-synthetase-like protein